VVTGISGTPPRDFAEGGSGRNDWRASSDTTSPRGFLPARKTLGLGHNVVIDGVSGAHNESVVR